MIDDSDSYAPVVAWSTICFFLVMALHLSWCTISVDWVNTFPQTALDKLVFMQTPRGFVNRHGQDGCLKLLRSFVWIQVCTKELVHLSLQGIVEARVERMSV